METESTTIESAKPWNKGRFIGQKPALNLKELWEIRIRLPMAKNIRELTLFNWAIMIIYLNAALKARPTYSHDNML